MQFRWSACCTGLKERRSPRLGLTHRRTAAQGEEAHGGPEALWPMVWYKMQTHIPKLVPSFKCYDATCIGTSPLIVLHLPQADRGPCHSFLVLQTVNAFVRGGIFTHL